MRVTPPMKAPAPTSANAPGSIHAQGEGGRKTPGGAPAEPAPRAAAMSTVARPTSRPMHAPISSIGTKTPLAIAEPAVTAAPTKYTKSIVSSAA